MTGILSQQHIGLLQQSHRPESNVFQIAHRRGYQIKFAVHISTIYILVPYFNKNKTYAADQLYTREERNRKRTAYFEEFQGPGARSEEHKSELQSLMRNSYAVLC